jgi:phosphoglycolate phosphatase-like HAD superfamily hydrolase
VSRSTRFVLFDVDGVLLDSLGPHLQICEDKGREYGLDLRIPTKDELCAMIKAGVPISPMIDFFKAVGFPDHLAEKADAEYQRIFTTHYAPRPYPGIHEALEALHDDGFILGIVTSNVRANIVTPLATSMSFFRSDYVLTKDSFAPFSKTIAIETAVARSGVPKACVTYVGDQPADVHAAKSAGVDFLGAAYGWGVSGNEADFPSVRRPGDIARYFGAARARTGVTAG